MSITQRPSFTLIKALGFISLIALLTFPEVSLITTNAFLKKSFYSPYLFRYGLFTLADYLIVTMIITIAIVTYRSQKIMLGFAWPFLIIYFFYFAIGLYYNVFVYFEFKALLYDFKAFLYFFVPYLLIVNLFQNFKINLFFCLNTILFLNFFGAFYDYFISKYSQVRIEYPSHAIYPSPLDSVIFPIVFALMYGWRNHISVRWNYFYIVLIFFGITSSILNYKLGVMLQFLLTLVALLFIHLLHITNSSSTSKLTILYYLLYLLIPSIILIIFTPGGLKSDGINVRLNEIYIFFKLFFEDFPILIGKGLGSTWFKDSSFHINGMEYNLGLNFISSPVNFVWHNSISGHFYKFGIIGSLSIVGYSAYLANRAVCNTNKSFGDKDHSISISFGFLIITYLILILNGPGELKYGVIAGTILALYSQHLNTINYGETKPEQAISN